MCLPVLVGRGHCESTEMAIIITDRYLSAVKQRFRVYIEKPELLVEHILGIILRGTEIERDASTAVLSAEGENGNGNGNGTGTFLSIHYPSSRPSLGHSSVSLFNTQTRSPVTPDSV